MKVQIESPYESGSEGAKIYLARALRDSLNRGESPFASHGLYTLALDDSDPEQRELGVMAGFEYMLDADKVVVYYDRGISDGMKDGINYAIAIGKPIEFRSLYE